MSTYSVKFSCTQCENDNYKFWGEEYTGVTIVKCKTCSLRYVNPRRRQDEIESVYHEEYWIDLDIHKTKNRYQYHFVSLIKALEYCQKENPSILDVGAGNAGFLKTAKIAGYENLTGIDITAHNMEEFKKFGIPFEVGDITTRDFGKFDIVNAQHVLEHVLDPFEFLRSVKRSLNEDGIAHIVVPNEGGVVSNQKSLLSRLGLKKKPYKHLTPWQHLFFFDLKSFRFLAEAAGFEILYLGTRSHPKDKGSLYQLVHNWFDVLKVNSHIQAVLQVRD